MVKQHDPFIPPNPRIWGHKGVMFFDHFLVPFSKAHRGLQKPPKISSAKIVFCSIFDRFLIDFGRFLEALMCFGKGNEKLIKKHDPFMHQNPRTWGSIKGVIFFHRKCSPGFPIRPWTRPPPPHKDNDIPRAKKIPKRSQDRSRTTPRRPQAAPEYPQAYSASHRAWS